MSSDGATSRRVMEIETILLASTNRGKTAELAAQMSGLARIICLSDLAVRPPAPEETGLTFRENALLKGDYYYAQTGLLTMADDSGLEVEALGGRPGVFSARYGGEHLTDAERNRLLLAELAELQGAAGGSRRARFVCSLALVGPGRRLTFEGTCEGWLAPAPLGENGFGYDPIFIDPASGQTFGQLTAAQKSRMSHRGRAMKRLKDYWQSNGGADPGTCGSP